MEWNQLGTIRPKSVWEFYPGQTGSTVFLLKHSWSIPFRFTPRALIAQVYADGEMMGARRIYPREGAGEILYFPIPEDLANEGAVLRRVAVRMLPPRYNRQGPFEYDWDISLSALAQSSPTPSLGSLLAELEQTEFDITEQITQLRDEIF